MQEIMSSNDLPDSRKHQLTPPDPLDRVKRLRITHEQYHSSHTDSSEKNENADYNRSTDPAPQQGRKSTAKMFCGSCYDLDVTVKLEINSTWKFRFEGTQAMLLITLNNLSTLQKSLSTRTRNE